MDNILHILKICYNKKEKTNINKKKEALLALTSHPASHPPPLSQWEKSCAKYLLNLYFITEVILDSIFYSES